MRDNKRKSVLPLSILNILTDLINALPGNSSVNMNRGGNRRETVFLCGPRRVKSRCYRKSVVRQRSCKHASVTMGDVVFRGVRERSYVKRNSATIQF
jgi:hypothetical protein